MKQPMSCRAQTDGRMILAVWLLLLLVCAMRSGWSQINVDTLNEKRMQLGASELLDFDGIERTAVSNPQVADYVVLSTRQIMLLSRSVGETKLYVWDKQGQHAFQLVVVPPPSRLPELVTRITQAIANPAIRVSLCEEAIVLEGEVETAHEMQRAEKIARICAPTVENLIRVRAQVVEKKPPYEIEEIRRALGESVTVTPLADGILMLEGKATPAQKTRIEQILKALGSKVTIIDLVTPIIGPPRQIMVHVIVAEISKTDLRELGIEWGGLNDAGVHDQPIIFGEVSTGPFSLDELGPFRRLEGISARLKALVTNNRARILAKPNLLVVERQVANILVGGEIPIPVLQNGGNSSGAVSVEWKEFGVKLAMSATIDPDEQSINLDVAPEVSNLDFSNGITVSNILLPALQTRRVHSVLHVRNRSTLVIGGLYQVEQSTNLRKIPLLGDIPLVGKLFQRTDKKKRETELVVFVTPEIVTEASTAAQTDAARREMEEVLNDDRTRR